MHAAQPVHHNPGDATEQHLWLPPGRLWRYQVVKLGAAGIALAIFGLWLTLRWHEPMMRWGTLALITVTVWVVARSIVTDVTRARGRQLQIRDDTLYGTTPDGDFTLALRDVAEARWRDDADATLGLWLLDAHGHTLVHLDGHFLADESEARDFLRWARQRSTLQFPVKWPDRTPGTF